jgi:hypothetical protein
MFSVSFKARESNPGNIYIGNDTTTAIASGWELQPGEYWSIAVSDVQENQVPGTIKAHVWYMSAPSTVSKVDWSMILET